MSETLKWSQIGQIRHIGAHSHIGVKDRMNAAAMKDGNFRSSEPLVKGPKLLFGG